MSRQMKIVTAEEIVQWRRDMGGAVPEKTQEIVKHLRSIFQPSTKHTKSSKRRSQFSFPVNLDDTLGIRLDKDEDQESILKGVLMSLNRLSDENVDEVVKDMNRISMDQFDSFRRVAQIILHKTNGERTYRKTYIDLIERVQWAINADGYRYTLTSLFIMELQKMFESIHDKMKAEGCSIMTTIGTLYETDILKEAVYDDIVDYLLQKRGGEHSVEYVVSFLKACPGYKNLSPTIKKMTAHTLPMRLRMLLESFIENK